MTISLTDSTNLQDTQPLDVPDFILEPSVVFTPRSFFHDRYQPGPDIIQLPQRVKPGGEVSVSYRGPNKTNPRRGLRLIKDKIKGQRRTDELDITDGYVVDLRANSPQNWSHLLNFHIPLLALVETEFGLPLSEITAVFPFDMPQFARSALALLGVSAVFTDGLVRGRLIEISLSHENVHRTHSRTWFLQSEMAARKARAEDGMDVPKRVLIGRRGSRGLVAQERFERLLEPLGFSTVYPERLSVAEQFSLFSRCETIVAVHGAALGPLLLRTEAGRPPPHVVGIMPSGVVSDFFRMMSQQVGSRWVGIRGKVRPEYVAMAYDLQRTSLSGFESHDVEIDTDALLLALDHVWNAADHRIAPTLLASLDKSQ